jgi:hypothetical protein
MILASFSHGKLTSIDVERRTFMTYIVVPHFTFPQAEEIYS